MQPSLSKTFLEKNETSTYFLLQFISNLAILNSQDTSTKDSRFPYHTTEQRKNTSNKKKKKNNLYGRK